MCVPVVLDAVPGIGVSVARNERLIDASPDEVFDELIEPDNFGHWVVGTKQVRGADEDWPQVGSRFHHTVGFGPVHIRDTTEVLEIARPGRLVMRALMGPLGSAIVRLLLERHGDATLVAMEEFPDAGPVTWLPDDLNEVLATMRNVRALERLKQLVESEEHAGELEERTQVSRAGGTHGASAAGVAAVAVVVTFAIVAVRRRRRRRRDR